MARGNKSSGYSNPMQDHHKKARQKELNRNKQKRTKERDEKAIQTKTVTEVKEEIQKLEKDMKRHQHGQQQKSASEHKLARLQKELKILTEAEAAAKAKADADAEAYKIANQYRQPQRPLTELDDPRKSVYYDKVMNPYGAPPPGKPRLYHRRFGGVTPNPHEAVVPGEEPHVSPPPPPPRYDANANARYGQQSHHRHQVGAPDHRQHQNQYQNQRHQQQQQQQQQHRPYPNRRPQQQHGESSSHPPPPPKRQPLHIPPSNQSQSTSENVKSNNDASPSPVSATKEEKALLDSKRTKSSSSPPQRAIPSLPKPSEAVQRTMRVARNKNKKASLADIWASTEEVEYERFTNLVDLEADDLGTAKASNKKKKKQKKKKKKPPLEFYYRDNTGNVQGPFSKAQMKGWMDAGYFPPITKARTNRMDPDGWVPMGDLPALKETPKDAAGSSKTKTDGGDNSVQDRIAALKGTGKTDDDDEGMDASMQARIAAMREDLMVPDAAGNDDSVENRIAALRGNGNNDDNDDGDTMEASMQARIAAMKADLMSSSVPVNSKDDAGNEDSVQDRIAALRNNVDNTDNDDGDVVDPAIQARIAAMRADLAGPGAATGVGQAQEEKPPHVGAETGNSSLQDRIAALRKNAPPPPAVKPSLDESSNHTSLRDRIAALRKNAPPPPPPPPPAYPVDNDIHYSDETGPSAYLLGDADDAGVAAYPIDDNEDSDGAAAYPTPYPMDGDDNPLGTSDDMNNEDDAVAPYPTDEAYPGGEDLAYPVTDSYLHEDEGGNGVMYDQPPYETSVAPKKSVKVDKALISFIPTNLQTKKRKAEEPKETSLSTATSLGAKTHPKKIKASTKTVNAVTANDDNYNKFLEEIDGL